MLQQKQIRKCKDEKKQEKKLRKILAIYNKGEKN